MTGRTILVSGFSAAGELQLRNAVPEVEFRAIAPADNREQLRSIDAPGAIVSLAGNAESAFKMVRDLGAAGIRVVVVGPEKDADLILRAMREGAKEYVTAGDVAALAHALRAQLRPALEAGGRIYAAFPSKGGVGATTISTNFAGSLQARGGRVCLVDLNLNMGDVLAFLDLAGGYSISDVITNMRRLDKELLDATLLRHGSGVHVLAQSHRVEDSDRVDAPALGALLGFLRQHFDAVVLDGLRSFDDLSVSAVDASDSILLILTQEVPAVRDARRCSDLFARLGCEQKLKVVVNRYQKTHEINDGVITETVGLPVAATVANDYPAVIRAVNRGVLLVEDAPRSQVARDIDALVHVVGHVQREDEPRREKRSLFKRFFPMKANHATD